ncbi:hypothetical protein BJF93_01965 [Xaviernesmea oryzae]|uniref:Nitrate reductase n=1 Tax=Xaviernesmea oryzae TaxID=464029 RepID=A0A1Q9B3F1_9HYPH|nr:hypothetical protein [Xaviernesmea oryzae]OLP62578.1 hypothetical protein BJF93_01965 [Xaviernesmea oryzae]SEM18809.1 hypothetical protein SAMN04487976_1225 [Xaviernesmea oryzae]
MSAFVNPLAPRRPRAAEAVARIREWLRGRLALADGTVIVVNEVACAEPGCPDLETVIGLLSSSAASRTFKISKPIAAVTTADLERMVNGEAAA